MYQGVEVDAVNKPSELIPLYEKNTLITNSIDVKFPKIENTRTIDYLMELNSQLDLNVVLKELEYEIVKYKKNEIKNYVFKNSTVHNEIMIGKNIIFKNKLAYQYNSDKSEFESRISDLGYFIVEPSEKIVLKGKMILNINGINNYLFFEKSANLQTHKATFEIKKI